MPGISLKNIRSSLCLTSISPHSIIQRDSLLQQLTKFGFVGLLNTAIGYGVFILFLSYTNYIYSLMISHIIGVIHSFIWNKYWTFKSDRIRLDEFIKFNSVYVVVFIANAIILILFVNNLNLNPRIGQLIVLPIVTVVSFTGHKYWSFRK